MQRLCIASLSLWTRARQEHGCTRGDFDFRVLKVLDQVGECLVVNVGSAEVKALLTLHHLEVDDGVVCPENGQRFAVCV